LVTVNEYRRAAIPPIPLSNNAGLFYVIDRIITDQEMMTEAIKKVPYVSPFRSSVTTLADPCPCTPETQQTLSVIEAIKSVLKKHEATHSFLLVYLDESVEFLLQDNFGTY
jgi:hypothetical protein